MLLSDLVAAGAELDAVRALGVKVALDDFGTGYTSLAHIQQLPIDTLKIDRSFISNLSMRRGTLSFEWSRISAMPSKFALSPRGSRPTESSPPYRRSVPTACKVTSSLFLSSPMICRHGQASGRPRFSGSPADRDRR